MRDFFTHAVVPQHLLKYKDLFVFQTVEKEESLGADFDARVMSRIEVPIVKAKQVPMISRIMPLFRAAAVVAVILSLGSVVQHSFDTGADNLATVADTIGNQISTPSVAQSEKKEISKEQQMLDSLKQISEKKVEVDQE